MERANDDPAKPSSHLRIEYQDSSSAINVQQNRTDMELDRWRWINNKTCYPDLYDRVTFPLFRFTYKRCIVNGT